MTREGLLGAKCDNCRRFGIVHLFTGCNHKGCVDCKKNFAKDGCPLCVVGRGNHPPDAKPVKNIVADAAPPHLPPPPPPPLPQEQVDCFLIGAIVVVALIIVISMIAMALMIGRAEENTVIDLSKTITFEYDPTGRHGGFPGPKGPPGMRCPPGVQGPPGVCGA
jgi:hypothetical protein